MVTAFASPSNPVSCGFSSDFEELCMSPSRLASLIPAAFLLLTGLSPALAEETAAPRVKMETTLGDIVLQLDAEKAPGTVENFLAYVDEGYYDGTQFHRVISGFMVQGGGLDADMNSKPTRASIQNEANNGLKNDRGTVSMARTNAPHSATAQFFINLADNKFLDHTAETPRGWGYAVFGQVTEGMDVVDQIAAVETGIRDDRRDVPVETVLIKKISRISE